MHYSKITNSPEEIIERFAKKVPQEAEIVTNYQIVISVTNKPGALASLGPEIAFFSASGTAFIKKSYDVNT